ncbi:hypothetical protein PP740_gp012 [Stenotrophomonas phage Philippe]|uniref:Uncharacterized protein n=1 Tax=Stenotrophomonas phage Philippe TaxID=2859655 RepID=A0AAE7WMH2_9CAUD|nr:hypothetical protein PP740_gp012 [Stenotrophomonas phage Philippe]QYW02211.1 hypothetical protein CPT_Philippe_012 [Stenotrophomonas phage Philippe]
MSAYEIAERMRKHALENRNSLTDADHKHWQDLLAEGRIVEAIKAFRAMTACNLKQAKDTVEHYRARKEIKYFW